MITRVLTVRSFPAARDDNGGVSSGNRSSCGQRPAMLDGESRHLVCYGS